MNINQDVNAAEEILLNNGDLVQFNNCLADNTEQKIYTLYQRGLNNPKLKESLIKVGFWSAWDSQFSNELVH